LSKLPSGTGALDADLSTLLAEFEVIKAAEPKESKQELDDFSSEAASFDVISQMSADSNCTMRPALFSSEFMQSLQRPLCEWLLGSVSLSKEQSEQKDGSVKSMKRRHSFDSPVSAKRYEFETVMRRVCESGSAGWCLSQKESESSEAEGTVTVAPQPSTSTAEETLPPRAKTTVSSVVQVDEKKFVDKLNLLFREMTFSNTNGQKTALNNVEQWRALLNKMHTSQDWLAK
jgi:hypothetical protein